MLPKKLRRAIILAILYLLLILFLFNTNPQKINAGFLIVPFVLLFVALFFTFTLLLDIYLRSPILRRKRFIIALLIALLPTLLLIMQSINQLSPGDILLVLALGAFAVFYASKLKLGGTR